MNVRQLLVVVVVSFFTAFVAIGFLLGSMPPIAKGAVCQHRADEPGKMACGNGDVNADGDRNIADAVYLLSYLFAQGPAPYASADERVPSLEEKIAELTERVEAVEAEQANRKPLLDDLEFGKKIAGVYCHPTEVGELLALSADGSCVYVNSWQTNPGCPEYPEGYFIPGWYGTWHRTGERTIRVDTWSPTRVSFAIGDDNRWNRLVFYTLVFNDDFSAAQFNGHWKESGLSTNIDPSSCDAPWTTNKEGTMVLPWIRRQPLCD